MGRPSPYTQAQIEAAGLQLPVAIALEAVEVTQVIQNLRHEVPLIAMKATVTRCYLGAPDGSGAVSCRGELQIDRDDGASFLVPSSNAADVCPLAGDEVEALRGDLARSLNFRLPEEACAPGTARVWLKSVFVNDGAAQAPVQPAGGPVSVSFVWAPPLRVKLFSIRHQLATSSTVYAPGALDIELTRSWLLRAYPTAEVIFTHATIDAPRCWPFSCKDINLQLAAIRRQDISDGADPRTHYYGLVSDANGRSFMRGCASDVPAFPSPDTVASGPSGSSDWGWDFDGSYADWYSAHELAHTFGRKHPGYCGNNSSDDPAFPYPDGSLTTSQDGFMGFDAGDAALGLPMAVMPGVTWRDVMTYCENQWMSAYTFEGIHRRMLDEDSAGSPPPAAPLAGAALESAQDNVRALTGLVNVLALIELDENTGRIAHVAPVTRGAPSRPDLESPAVIEVLDEDGSVLSATPLHIKESTCCEGEAHRHGMIDALLAVPPEARAVRLKINGVLADTFHAQPMPEEPGWLERMQSSQPAIAAAPDLEANQDSNIRFMAQVSTDQGKTWETVATGLRRPLFEPDKSQYPGASSLLVRIKATDGFSVESATREIPLK